MNLLQAREILCKDQMNWRKPHLNWLPRSLYRYFNESKS
jgi:hypothetical protein